MVHPTPTAGVLGKDVRLTCMAVSSSSSPMTFTWWKNQEPLPHAHVENFAHSTSRDRAGIMEYTTVLHLRDVKFEDEGRYQCVISNQFGSTYSNKAILSISGRFYFYTLSSICMMICFSNFSPLPLTLQHCCSSPWVGGGLGTLYKNTRNISSKLAQTSTARLINMLLLFQITSS